MTEIIPDPDVRLTWDDTWMALAVLMSYRSRCPTGAGAAIVDSQQRVVATGYAGPPAGYDLTQENVLAERLPFCRSYCLRQRGHVRGRRDLAHDYSDCPSSHAEANAISFADRSRTEAGTFYVSRAPCVGCTKLIANSGVIRAVWRADPEVDQVAGVKPAYARNFLERCGIEVNTDG